MHRTNGFARGLLAVTIVLRTGLAIAALPMDGDLPAGSLPAVEYFALPPGTLFEKVTVGADGATSSAGSGERLIYSNTLGLYVLRMGANMLVSDDLATLAPDGCRLSRFRFQVTGRVVPTDAGSEYTVRYSLYDTCPSSVPSAMRSRYLGDPLGGIKIAGTDGEITFPDDAPRTIEHIVDPNAAVTIPTNVWLGVQFTRPNCGTVLGAPATIGFSADMYDFPGFPCNAYLGGFPLLPHASFNAEVWADADCPMAFPGYKATKPSGPPVNHGAQVWFADDVSLQIDGCQMIAYEVALKNPAYYTFELRESCNGPPIPGTTRSFLLNTNDVPQTQLARMSFDPPIPIPRDFWIAFNVVNIIVPTGGVVVGVYPVIGTTAEEYAVINPDTNECMVTYPPAGVYGAFHASITCAGSPPSGACCDMVLLECEGGPDSGKRCPCNALCQGGPTSENGVKCCRFNSDCQSNSCVPTCAAPGTCESVCREGPQMNCPWPTRGSAEQPAWVKGGTCDANPFPHTCGLASCCLPDDTCENLTRNQCEAALPPAAARLWQRGYYCYEGAQSCPFIACLEREGSCFKLHGGVGCNNPICCQEVCEADPWCCHVEWDRSCLDLVFELCPVAPPNDVSYGAADLSHNAAYYGNNELATADSLDPGFCCNVENPGGQAYSSVWFKFVATHESAQIDTCASDPSGDSLVNVFEVDDALPSSSMSLIACGDDGCPKRNAEGPPTGMANTLFCVEGLTPGNTYYIMMASRTAAHKGTYQIELRTPCQGGPSFISTDCNENGSFDGCDLEGGTSRDCNDNRVLDECESAPDPSVDCDDDGVTDSCSPFRQKLIADAMNDYDFGSAIGASGDWLLVGDSTENGYGIVRAFRRLADHWVEVTRFTAPDVTGPGSFGTFLAVDDDWALVVAPFAEVSGKVYAFQRTGDDWEWRDTFPGVPIAPITTRSRWSHAVVDDDWAAVAAQNYEGNVIFLFRRTGTEWTLEGRLPKNCQFSHERFAFALNDDRLAVSSSQMMQDGVIVARDSIQFFELLAGTWHNTGSIQPFDGADDADVTLAMSGDILVVPRALYGGYYGQIATGAYVYLRTASGWHREADLVDVGSNPELLKRAVALLTPGTVALATREYETNCMRGKLFSRNKSGYWDAVGDLSLPSCSPFEQRLTIAGTSGFAAIGVTFNGAAMGGGVYTFALPSIDCDRNGGADACELRDGAAEDCNDNEALDVCETRVFGDFDFNRHLDLVDFAGLQRCFTDPSGGTLGVCCGVFDAEPRDGDADLADFVAFVSVMMGP